MVSLLAPVPPSLFKESDLNGIRSYVKTAFSRSDNAQRLHRIGRALAGKVRYFVIAFPQANPAMKLQEVKDIQFAVSDQSSPSPQMKLCGSHELASRIHNTLGISIPKVGSSKPVNRRTADAFHSWSRTYLASSIRKVDIDGFICSSRARILVEVKRSNIPPIPQWRPYTADAPDFALLAEFGRLLSARLAIVHHSTSPDAVAIDPHSDISVFWLPEKEPLFQFTDVWNPISLSDFIQRVRQ